MNGPLHTARQHRQGVESRDIRKHLPLLGSISLAELKFIQPVHHNQIEENPQRRQLDGFLVHLSHLEKQQQMLFGKVLIQQRTKAEAFHG